MRSPLAFLLSLLLFACGLSSDPDGLAEPDVTVADLSAPADVVGDTGGPVVDPHLVGQGAFSVRVLPDSQTLQLERDGVVLLRLAAEGLQLGVADALLDHLSYDPWPLVAGDSMYRPPAGMRWLAVRSLAVNESAAAGQLDLSLGYDEGWTARLVVEALDEGRFRARWRPEGGSAPVVMMRLRAQVDAEEGFYGLGEWFDTPNHRGLRRAMQLELDTEMRRGYNEAHVPVPYLTGTTGWGLFVESFYPGVFDVATQADDVVEATFGTGPGSSEGLVFHLFAAAHPLDLTRHYYEATAYPRLPAPWALGPWIWRDENEDQAQVESDLETIRALDLATTAYWIDRPYATGVNTFDYGAEKFTDADAMIAKMHALGFRTALWHTPYLDERDESTAALRAEAVAQGYYAPESGALFNGWGKPIDLTNPAAYDWWQGLIRRYTDMGVEGFKLDYGEDVLVGVAGGRSPWLFHDGSTERTMHSRFQLFYHRVYAELLPEDGGFLLCRGGTFGDQAYCNVIWPGDLDATMGRHRAPGENGKLGVGGLPAAVVAGSSLGPSGFPFFASDTGGYDFSPPNKETFTRWFQHTALTPVMQVGTSANDVAWEGNERNGFDEEMLGWYRDYVRLHLRLFPFLWSYAQGLAQDGRPIQRALGLAHPELGVHPPFVYLLGEELLVAPVVDEGAREWEVLTPGGRWHDWFTGEVLEGAGPHTVAAPLDKLPLYLREGGLVPLLRPTIDTLSPTTEPEKVDSFATSTGPLHVRAVPGEGAFTLYDGTALSQRVESGVHEIEITPGAVFTEGAVLELMAYPTPPQSVQSDGVAYTGWRWSEEAGGLLFVELPLGAHTVRVTP